ncbi:MAG TPA: hypothetical protein VF041_23330 [Gemmatimonadaceae bacterium]
MSIALILAIVALVVGVVGLIVPDSRLPAAGVVLLALALLLGSGALR